MAIFRRGIPRRALIAAFIGFVYGGLVMPTGGTREFFEGVGWVILAISLLFGRPISYYTYVAWAILWVAWKGTAMFRGEIVPWYLGMIDVVIPAVSIALMSSSGYLEMARGEGGPTTGTD